MQETQDTEVTLGTGRLLALFFGLVVICALFFSVGFSLGRKSAPAVATTAAPAPAPVVTTPGEKPTALKSDNKADCAVPENCPPQTAQAGSTSDELTFYKAVEQKDAKTQLDQPAPNPPTVFASKPNDAKPDAPRPDAKATEVPKTGYMVQVAAVSKQDDADALVAALRKKQYPVFASTVPTDKLYHVQVGPFSDPKQADEMKAKLVSDGYNPIVKR